MKTALIMWEGACPQLGVPELDSVLLFQFVEVIGRWGWSASAFIFILRFVSEH